MMGNNMVCKKMPALLIVFLIIILSNCPSPNDYNPNDEKIAPLLFEPAPEAGPVERLIDTVTITCSTGDVEIHYTIDGSTPTTLSPLYVTPLTFETTGMVTVRAMAAKAEMRSTSTARADYIVEDTHGPYPQMDTSSTIWNEAPLFTITFDEEVIGFDTDDITLTGTEDYSIDLDVSENPVFTVILLPVNPENPDSITIEINEGVCTDVYVNSNSAAVPLTLIYEPGSPSQEPTPESTPTPEDTPEQTTEPTAEPTPDPTQEETPEPTTEPTPDPSPEDTEEPTTESSDEPTSAPTETPDTTSVPTPEPTPTLTPGQAILLEAEDYTDFYDTTSGNEGNIYRNDDVDIESCSEGGYNVGWIEQDEWLQYDISMTESDTFTIYVRIASPMEKTEGFRIQIDGSYVTNWVSVPDTGAWQGWEDVVVNDIAIDAGSHTIRITMNGDFNFNFIYIVSSTNPPEPTEPPGALPTSTPPPGYTSVVDQYGHLKVIETYLCSEDSTPIRLKGMSTHGLQWFPIMKEHTIHNLVYDWGISVIRPAMYVEDYKNDEFWGGYIAQPEYMKGKVIEAVDDAIDVGIYVLIDWHIHNDPTNFTSEAIAFFQEMAAMYGSYPNIIYEICNEPEYVSWNTVKTYANDVIPQIRSIDPDNIILVGTPNWCQDVDVVSDDPLTGYTNIMYSLHFYAGSHSQSLRDKADYALIKGLPLFVSEWGTSDSTGGSNGNLYLTEAAVWANWMNQTYRSWINWSFCNRSESSAALLAGVNIGGPWEASDLSESGSYVNGLITAEDPTPAPTPTSMPGGECAPGTPITLDFIYDGAGEFCWEATSLGCYINSWNLDELTVNGVDFTNQYVGAASLPDKIDGKYYVYYKSPSAYGHFEAIN
jgi:aryl-phospho-beta-D-glucosidase BglC (GH1 family)